MSKSGSFIILLLSMMVNHLCGQDLSERSFQRYTIANGLSNDYVTGVLQDATGYIWTAGSSGLNRFDGNSFVQFHSTDDSLSIGSEETNGMTWLNKDLFAVYSSGLHIVNTKTGETRNIFIPFHNKQYQYKFNHIMKAIGDEDGNIFILTRSGFYQYDKNYTLVFRYDAYKESQTYTEHFFFGRELVQLDDQRFLITSIYGLYIYNKEKKQFRKLEAADCPLLAGVLDYPKRSQAFLQSKPGNVFILSLDTDSLVYINILENRKVVTHIPINPLRNEFRWRTRLIAVSDTLFYLTSHFSGIYKLRFYPESGKVKFYQEKLFPTYLCTSLTKDKEGHLWISTNKGLLRQSVAKSQVELAVLPPRMLDTIADIRFDDIYVTADKIYAGTSGPGTMFVFDKKTLKLDNEISFGKRGRPGNLVRAIAMADSNNILLGTEGALILFNHKTGTQTKLSPPGWHENYDWVSDLSRDSKGNVWVSAARNYKYDPAAKSFKIIPNHERLLSVPFGLEEDRDGHIWMAGHGVARYNTILEKFDLLVDSFPFIKMPNRQVGALAIDQQNVVWFNSGDNGLIGYDINKKTFRQFTRNNGLPDNNLSSMIIIDNKLWIAAPSGIACMDLRTYEIKSFGKEDGFPATPVMRGARLFYDKADRKLYIGFLNTVVRFDPITLLQSKKPPHVFIENLAISNKVNNFLPDSAVTTSWKSNEITITIGSINFSDASSQAFAYRIVKDEETAWQQLGSQPSFSISNLSPGTHRIQVKTFSLNNRWPPQVKEISVVVLPPFWKKDWFVILLTVAISVLLYLFIKWRTGMARKKEMEKTRIQKLIADDYKNQFELEQVSNYFSSSLADKKTEDEVLWDVAGNLIGKMNYVDCMIYLWNQDKTKMVQKAAYGPKGNPEVISENVFDVLPGQGVVGHVIQTRQPILINDTRKDGRYRVDEQFRLSEVCVPIIHNDELLGVIDSEHNEANYFSERDIKMLTTIATLLGNKLKQIESDRSLEAKGKEIATINEQLVEARLSALQAQMNPHFVFNALNSIKRMILDGDNEKASRYLSKFALMIRMTLNHSKDTFVTLDENIEYLKTYLEMERLRFDESFTYKILVAENIDTSESSIPSLMIQPLVENAIWHGLLPSEGEKKILVKFTQNENRITCVIEDNGVGIRQSEKLKAISRPLHNSVGLENLRKRIKIMNEKYDTDCSLEIIDLKESVKGDRGTKVVLRFNLI